MRDKFKQIIGTGGIGSGILFKLEGNQPLGREESRAGILTPFKDYCKLHIIFHYLAVLLKDSSFLVRAIGRVGEDHIGAQLLSEMEEAGIDVTFVEIDPTNRTLFSACFQYPDLTGGNITSSNSASGSITPKDIDQCIEKISEEQNHQDNFLSESFVMAVPEVSIDTRLHLLNKGKQHGSFNVASVLSGEVEEFARRGGFELVDLLAINIDEAKAIVSYFGEGLSHKLEEKEEQIIALHCAHALTKLNPEMYITITMGSKGCYGYSEGELAFTPCAKVEAIGTAGAGDAFLAGTLMGLYYSLPFKKDAPDTRFAKTPLASAIELGTLVAAMAVTSPDTINHGLNTEVLSSYVIENKIEASEEFLSCLGR